MRRLEDKRAVVTGASAGIGGAIALRLGAEGARVAISRSSTTTSTFLPDSKILLSICAFKCTGSRTFLCPALCLLRNN